MRTARLHLVNHVSHLEDLGPNQLDLFFVFYQVPLWVHFFKNRNGVQRLYHSLCTKLDPIQLNNEHLGNLLDETSFG
jgi:hypothetical protein